MRKVLAIVGSGVFLVIAPGFVAGVVPWWISRWRFEAPFFGLALFRFVGGVLITLGVIGLLDSFIRFTAGPGHAGAGLPNAPFGCFRPVSLCAKSDVRSGSERHSRPGLGSWKRDAA